MAANVLTFSDLYNRLLAYHYNGSSAAGDVTEAKQIVNDGNLLFQSDHNWSHITKAETLYLWPSVAVGTTTVSASTLTVTATVASFYPSMVGRTLTVTDIGDRTITGYTSATVVTVDTTFTGSHTFSIDADGYGMSADFEDIIDSPVLILQAGWPALDERPAQWVLGMLESSSRITGMPAYYAIQPRVFAVATGQRWDMIVYPRPSQLYTATIRSRIAPATMTSDSEYPQGGGLHSLTILQAILRLWEERKGQMAGINTELYYKIYLPQSIAKDASRHSRNLGQINERAVGESLPTTWPATYTQ